MDYITFFVIFRGSTPQEIVKVLSSKKVYRGSTTALIAIFFLRRVLTDFVIVLHSIVQEKAGMYVAKVAVFFYILNGLAMFGQESRTESGLAACLASKPADTRPQYNWYILCSKSCRKMKRARMLR